MNAASELDRDAQSVRIAVFAPGGPTADALSRALTNELADRQVRSISPASSESDVRTALHGIDALIVIERAAWERATPTAANTLDDDGVLALAEHVGVPYVIRLSVCRGDGTSPRGADDAPTGAANSAEIRLGFVLHPQHLGLWRTALGRTATPRVQVQRVVVPRGWHDVQAIHPADAARATAVVLDARGSGVFDACTEDRLDPRALAGFGDDARVVTLPINLAAALRRGTVLADDAASSDPRVPVDVVDAAITAPRLDPSRLEDEFAWRPARTSAETLRMYQADSPPSSGETPWTDRPQHPKRAVSRRLLGIYLADHLAGATAGSGRVARMSDAFSNTAIGPDLARSADEIAIEREYLRQLVHVLRLRERRVRQAIAWVAERIGRLKGNGRVVAASPVTLLLEAELMRSAVVGKLGLWQTLGRHADDLGLDATVIGDLSMLTREQLDRLDAVHEFAVGDAFTPPERSSPTA